MGGLLDKANAAKDTESTEEPAPVKVSSTNNATSASDNPGLLVQKAQGGPSDSAMKVSLAGWVIILVGAILSLQGGAWGFAVVGIVLVAGIGAIVQGERMKGDINQVKLGG